MEYIYFANGFFVFLHISDPFRIVFVVDKVCCLEANWVTLSRRIGSETVIYSVI